MMDNKYTDVACGIITDSSGKILMGKREATDTQTARWEFPGGKREHNESLEQCLTREWREELNLEITDLVFFAHNITECRYSCHFFKGRVEDATHIETRVHEEVAWHKPTDILQLDTYDEDSFIIKSLCGKPREKQDQWFCYILRNIQPQYAHLSYNGSTNDPRRRLRQHNEEISGGARYTHGRGGGWEIYALLTGFVDHKNALSCEWRIKHTNGKPGKRPRNHLGTRGRIIGLNEVLKCPKWTSKCTIENRDVNYVLYIAEDVASLICRDDIPANITIITGIPAVM